MGRRAGWGRLESGVVGPRKRGQEGFLSKSLLFPDQMGRDIELHNIPKYDQVYGKKKIHQDMPKVTAAEIMAGHSRSSDRWFPTGNEGGLATSFKDSRWKWCRYPQGSQPEPIQTSADTPAASYHAHPGTPQISHRERVLREET